MRHSLLLLLSLVSLAPLRETLLRELNFCGKYYKKNTFSEPTIPYPAFCPLSVFTRHPGADLYANILYASFRCQKSSFHRHSGRPRTGPPVRTGAALCAPPCPGVFVAKRARMA
jgi:hypothetical protein